MYGMYYSGSQHMDISREGAQKRPTLTNWWMTQDAELKKDQLQWNTEKDGGSVSWNTDQARPDDDDDDDDDNNDDDNVIISSENKTI